MRTTIGLITIFIGAMMGDSECLIIPAVVIAIGTELLYAGYRRGEQDGDI